MALVFYFRDQMFLDISNIKTTCLSPKLFYCHLEPFVVKCQVGPLAYCLELLHMIKKLYSVFNIVKLSIALDNPIPVQKLETLPLLIIVNKEKK